MNYLFYLIILSNILTACTIGISKDSNGNAMLWKNRDRNLDSTKTKNRVLYNNEGNYSFISVTTSGSTATYMGLNEEGFGIANSLVIEDNEFEEELRCDEHKLIEYALENFSLVTEFENFIMNVDSLSSLNCGEEDYIISNFAVIDKTGAGKIFEIDTQRHYPDPSIESESLEDFEYLLRSNHFILMDNRNDLTDLDIESCENLTSNYLEGLSEGLVSNKLRYCMSKQYLESHFEGNSTMDLNELIGIDYLDDSDFISDIGLLRILNRSSIDSYQNINEYNLPYIFQSNYDCGVGRPSGYVYSRWSIARAQTVSSIVIKSLGDPQKSYMLAALGNPHIIPYVPFWVGEVPELANNNNDSQITILADLLRKKVFDYGRPEILDYNRWIDTQHLFSEGGTFENNIYRAISNFEQSIINNFMESNFPESYFEYTQEKLDSVEYILEEVFINNWDSLDVPIYKIGNQKNNICDGCDVFAYEGSRIVDRTMHRNHSEINEWVIKNNSTDFIFNFSEEYILNPIITIEDWENFDDLISIELKINDSGVADKDYNIGCHESHSRHTIIDNESCENECYGCMDNEAYNYDEYAEIENESCMYLGDINDDGFINVIDIVLLVENIFSSDPNNNPLADLNQDNIIDVLDIIYLVNIILDIDN